MDNKAPVISDDINSNIQIGTNIESTTAPKQPASEPSAHKEEKKADSTQKKSCLQRIAPFVSVEFAFKQLL